MKEWQGKARKGEGMGGMARNGDGGKGKEWREGKGMDRQGWSRLGGVQSRQIGVPSACRSVASGVRGEGSCSVPGHCPGIGRAARVSAEQLRGGGEGWDGRIGK